MNTSCGREIYKIEFVKWSEIIRNSDKLFKLRKWSNNYYTCGLMVGRRGESVVVECLGLRFESTTVG